MVLLPINNYTKCLQFSQRKLCLKMLRYFNTNCRLNYLWHNHLYIIIQVVLGIVNIYYVQKSVTILMQFDR